MTDRGSDFLMKIFEKYDTNSTCTLDSNEWYLFISSLKLKIQEISHIDKKSASIIFILLSNSDGLITFGEFCDWWNQPHSIKFHYFTEKNSDLILKAYNLYVYYASFDKMTITEFHEMMNGIGKKYTNTDFQLLDLNSDGYISFKEFFRWLGWVSAV